ncbi:ABC-type Fe3+-siderophore transport system permease subunit [Pseudomonas psychrotolerans]|nr:ABC-type Fe3+-siderophore transport system permease subunit [Pseudomonas psychrotolerans]
MRPLFLLGCAGLLLLGVMAASLALGATAIPLAEVWQALGHGCSDPACLIVREARLPRTLAGLLAGAALGVAGTLMQALTRNPLADPGILGVNAGASFAVVLGIALFGASGPEQYLGYAFGGALLASLVVLLAGVAGGPGGFNPMRLVLVGVALGAMLEGVSSGIALLDPQVYDQLRFWQFGSLDVRQLDLLSSASLPVLGGVIIALLLAPALNALSLGTDLAVALGTRVRQTQLLGLLAITLLCGAAAAAVGPIAFVGLMVPHLGRWAIGEDHRWLLPLVLLFTPSLLLTADIAGRLLVTGELRVSVVTAFLGAPLLIWLARRQRQGAHP